MYTLYCRSPAHLGDENILRLDISMKAVVLMAEVHSLENTHFWFFHYFFPPWLVNNNYIDVQPSQCQKVKVWKVFVNLEF